MWPWWIVYFLVPVFVGIVVTEYKSDIFRLLKAAFVHDGADNLFAIVVYVPSARGNFNQRKSIRETWLGHVNQNDTLRNRVMVKFVIGSEPCLVPVDDRLSEYLCDDWNISVPVVNEDEELYAVVEETSHVSDISSQTHQRLYGRQQISFTVRQPVVLTKLGMYTASVGSRAIVKLLDAATQKEIVSSIFSPKLKSVSVQNFTYRDVQPYYLPKGFEGVVVGENLASGSGEFEFDISQSDFVTLRNNASSVLHYGEEPVLPVGHYYDIRRWKSRTVDLVSFMFQVKELDSLKQHVATRLDRRLNWVSNVTSEQHELTSELTQFQDIIFVDIVDVYRNVPYKLLHFARWAVSEVKFSYLLKTDDDCFVDIVRVLQRLTEIADTSRRVWLGRFRHNWLVERSGKWAEPDYGSMVYPKFACGAGYVLSADLVRWLADNSYTLAAYQGEDVSMGIWLTAVKPNYIDEPLWQCEKECLSEMYVEPQLRPDELQQVWTDFMQCSDPCGCQ